MTMTLKLRIDPIACTGHGLCADLVPELIELDEWGYPIIRDSVPPGLAAHARRAVNACPALALRLNRVAALSRSHRSPGSSRASGSSWASRY
jgi:ferredoxin